MIPKSIFFYLNWFENAPKPLIKKIAPETVSEKGLHKTARKSTLQKRKGKRAQEMVSIIYSVYELWKWLFKI